MHTKQIGKKEIAKIGKEMQRMVVRAIDIIREESQWLVVRQKTAYDNKKYDCVTNADAKAQEMYIGEIRRLFPTFGIIAEEEEISVQSSHPGHSVYFTVDPLDGTKAYARKQSHGVGTMLALVLDGNVVAAYIGDINTGEIYGYSIADANGTTMRKRFGKISLLEPDVIRPLCQQYVFLLHAPGTHVPLIQKMYRPLDEGGLFKDMEVGGGSIGVLMARLWKGEIGAVCINPHFETPWDLTPIVGISQRLGFAFLEFDPNITNGKPRALGDLTEYTPKHITKITESRLFQVIVHKDHLPEIRKWIHVNQ